MNVNQQHPAHGRLSRPLSSTPDVLGDADPGFAVGKRPHLLCLRKPWG
jgi:hypothetical protein